MIAGVIIASRPQGYVVYPRLLLGISAGLRRLRVVGYTGQTKEVRGEERQQRIRTASWFWSGSQTFDD